MFVPLDAIIGGPEMAGQGWRMLMDSLAAALDLVPALASGAAQVSARSPGAYATVREQFGMSIGGFEGVEEKLGPIGGYTYLVDAARTLTAAAVERARASVLSAVAKAYMTEFMRVVVNDAMDVTAGAGISRGPRNTLSRRYAAPNGITVRVPTSSPAALIVFGQGAIRCHPWVLEEMHAVEAPRRRPFDRAFFGHVAFTVSNKWRSIFHGLTGAPFARPAFGGPLRPHFGYFTRLLRLLHVSRRHLHGLRRRLPQAARDGERTHGRRSGLDVLRVGSAQALRERRMPADGSAACPLRRREGASSTESAQLRGVLDNFPRLDRAHAPAGALSAGARHQRPATDG